MRMHESMVRATSTSVYSVSFWVFWVPMLWILARCIGAAGLLESGLLLLLLESVLVVRVDLAVHCEPTPFLLPVSQPRLHLALGFEALGFEALGFEALGFEALGFEALGFEALGFEAIGYCSTNGLMPGERGARCQWNAS